MQTGVVQLPGRLALLPFFLAAWVLSYLAPHLIAATIELFAMFALFDASDLAWDVAYGMIWIGILPVLYAAAQWMLMRRCLSAPVPWVVATYIGAVLARIGVMLIPDPGPRLLFGHSWLSDLVMMLVPWVGASLAVTIGMALPHGLCFAFAGVIPQTIVLPGARMARIAWVAVMIPAELVSTVVGEGLYRAFQLRPSDVLVDELFWPHAFALSYIPRSCAWLLVAVPAGLLMHAILKRRQESTDGRILQRFD